MDDLIESLFGAWLERHPHACMVLLVPMVGAIIHLYAQQWVIHQVAKMRRGDWLWLQGKRKPPPQKQKRHKSQPPIDPDETPT